MIGRQLEFRGGGQLDLIGGNQNLVVGNIIPDGAALLAWQYPANCAGAYASSLPT